MILTLLLVILVAIGLTVATQRGYKRYQKWLKAQNRLVMWQFGRFTNVRPGIKAHRFEPENPDNTDGWTDEPDEVEFTDYRYWIRLKPNPGFNIPIVGYYSEENGYARKPPRRF